MSPALVVVSLEAWDEVWRRNQYLVAELLERDPELRVLFVEPPADPVFALSRWRRPSLGRGLRPAPASAGVDSRRLWLLEPTKTLPRRVDPRADRRLADTVRRAARRLRLDDPVLWVNDPAGAHVLTATGWPSLYDVTDDWLAAERPPDESRRLAENEQVLLEHCAEVVVCSPALARSKGHGRDVTLVTNGVDVERYRRPAPRPADLPAGPIALYVGTVHPDRFDIATATATAAALAGDGRLVVVGPVLDVEAGERDALVRAGALLLGPRHRDQVPAYLQHAAVLVVPHDVNEFTDSLDPIKLYEYLAVGRPVVSTPVAGFRDSTAATVTVVDPAAFPAAVRAVVTTGPVRPAEPPRVPTWAEQASLMAAVVDRVAGRRATRP